MDDNKKRQALTDEEVELVAGGNIQYVCTATEAYAWGSHNPDVKYGFTSRRKMLAFIAENYDLYGEAGTLEALVDAGICYRM